MRFQIHCVNHCASFSLERWAVSGVKMTSDRCWEVPTAFCLCDVENLVLVVFLVVLLKEAVFIHRVDRLQDKALISSLFFMYRQTCSSVAL